MDLVDGVRAELLWSEGGWVADRGLAVAGDGSLADAGERELPRRRVVLPGVPNTHSHAFQRLMAGRTERMLRADDSFWSWRELMYDFAGRLDPEGLRVVATQLYAEMLRAGYTSVCEFHYLHHAPDGAPYDDPAAMSLAIVEAAREAGIGLTLLPVLYMRGGFDDRPLAPRQQRFRHGVDDFLSLLARLAPLQDQGFRLGLAFHSLRAVPMPALREVLDGAHTIDRDMPVHVHVAEQVAEVDDCLAAHGARPVERLLAEAAVDRRWTLVHATHLSEPECRALAASGATVSICPTTEANLGDGLFPLRPFLAAGGSIAIGSDSQASVSAVEELRWLEYGQRLAARARNLAALAPGESVGERLLAAVLAGGRLACGRPVGGLLADDGEASRADWIVLDDEAVELAGAGDRDLVDRWIFGASRPLVREVVVGGRQVVADGRHVHAERFETSYRRLVEQLG